MVIVLRLLFRAPVSATIKRTRIFLSLFERSCAAAAFLSLPNLSPLTGNERRAFLPTIKIQQVCSRNSALVIICAPGNWMKIPGRNLSEKEIYGRRYLLISIGHVIM